MSGAEQSNRIVQDVEYDAVEFLHRMGRSGLGVFEAVPDDIPSIPSELSFMEVSALATLIIAHEDLSQLSGRRNYKSSKRPPERLPLFIIGVRHAQDGDSVTPVNVCKYFKECDRGYESSLFRWVIGISMKRHISDPTDDGMK